MQPLVLLPAIHLVGGCAVRLKHRDEPGTDAIAVARDYASRGAEWIQIVDVDAAHGRDRNDDLVGQLLRKVPANLALAGGVRDTATLRAALDAGAARVTVGSAAVDDPDWAHEVFATFGEQVALGLDVREGRLVTHGGRSDGGPAYEVVEQMVALGCPRFVVRCLTSDGHLTGPSYELLGGICARRGNAAVVASGGIASLEDLRRLRGLVTMGVEGVIVGTALRSGRFTLEEALEITRGARPLQRPTSGEPA